MIGVCKTNGKGIWSPMQKSVPVEKLVVRLGGDATNYLSAEYGELCAYFNQEYWNVDTDGLIYTDPLWMEQFQKLLFRHGFSVYAVHNISYSEQGMQTRGYVSMDVGREFLRECDQLVSFVDGRIKTIEIELEY